MQPISTHVIKDCQLYFLKKTYKCNLVTRIQLSYNRRFIPFHCRNSKRDSYTPSESSFHETGGFLDTKTGTYFLCNNKVAYSPSDACKLCLTRPRSNADPSEWAWQGPAHTYCQINGVWTRLNNLDINLTNDMNAPRLRARRFYGKYVSVD